MSDDITIAMSLGHNELPPTRELPRPTPHERLAKRLEQLSAQVLVVIQSQQRSHPDSLDVLDLVGVRDGIREAAAVARALGGES